MHTEELTQYAHTMRTYMQSHAKQIIAGTALVAVAVVSVGGIGAALHGSHGMRDGHRGPRHDPRGEHMRGGDMQRGGQDLGPGRQGSGPRTPTRSVDEQTAAPSESVSPVPSPQAIPPANPAL